MVLAINKNTSVGELYVENQLSSQKPSRMVIGSMDFDASYPHDGEPITPADIGLKTIETLMIEPGYDITNELMYLLKYDAVKGTVVVYWFDFSGGAAAPATEVTDTTDLSDLTNVQFFAIGSV